MGSSTYPSVVKGGGRAEMHDISGNSASTLNSVGKLPLTAKAGPAWGDTF